MPEEKVIYGKDIYTIDIYIFFLLKLALCLIVTIYGSDAKVVIIFHTLSFKIVTYET